MLFPSNISVIDNICENSFDDKSFAHLFNFCSQKCYPRQKKWNKKQLYTFRIKKNLKVVLIHSKHNIGGAGGFQLTTKLCIEQKAKYVWMMDDDCVFDYSTLFTLIEEYNKDNRQSNIYSSLTLSFQNKTLIEPPLICLNSFSPSPAKNLSNKNTRFLRNLKDCKKNIILSSGNFFNSVLIHSTTFHKVGYPDPWFFIWGDEIDFLFRCWTHGIKVFTVTRSKVYTSNQSNYN